MRVHVYVCVLVLICLPFHFDFVLFPFTCLNVVTMHFVKCVFEYYLSGR